MIIQSKPTHDARILVEIVFKYTNSDPYKYRAELEKIGDSIVDYVEKTTGNHTYFEIDDRYEFEVNGAHCDTYCEALEELAGRELPSRKVYDIQYHDRDDAANVKVRSYRDKFEQVCEVFIANPKTFICNDLSLDERDFISALETGIAAHKIQYT